jgi:hypothetical protein
MNGNNDHTVLFFRPCPPTDHLGRGNRAGRFLEALIDRGLVSGAQTHPADAADSPTCPPS